MPIYIPANSICRGPLDFPVAQMVKNLPVVQETWVQSLDCEDPLEKRVATHTSILAWRIPCIEEPGKLVHEFAKNQT